MWHTYLYRISGHQKKVYAQVNLGHGGDFCSEIFADEKLKETESVEVLINKRN